MIAVLLVFAILLLAGDIAYSYFYQRRAIENMRSVDSMRSERS